MLHCQTPASDKALGSFSDRDRHLTRLLTLCPLCRPKDDEHGSGGKIIAGMPMSPTNGSHGTNGTSETVGLISGRKASR